MLIGLILGLLVVGISIILEKREKNNNDSDE